MKHLKTRKQLNEASENLNISDVSDSSSNTIKNAKNFLDGLGGFIYNILEEDGGIDRVELAKILVNYADSLK
jgi:hypothetical protein